MIKFLMKLMGIGWMLYCAACMAEDRNKTKEISSTETKPKALKLMQSKAKRVVKNDKGYWEAEFGDGHIMVFIPNGEFTMGSDKRWQLDRQVRIYHTRRRPQPPVCRTHRRRAEQQRRPYGFPTLYRFCAPEIEHCVIATPFVFKPGHIEKGIIPVRCLRNILFVIPIVLKND